MRPIAVAPLDRLVRNEPGVAAAAHALGPGAPPADVGLILVRHAEREAVQRRRSVRREVKNELVAVVEESVAVDRLVVADRQVPGQPGGGAGRRSFDRDRFDPVNQVLEPQVRAHGLGHVECRPRVARLRADVQEQRAVGPRALSPPPPPTCRSRPGTRPRDSVSWYRLY